MYLVCDGGGTKTEYLLFDLSGQIHAYSKGLGTNALFTKPSLAVNAVTDGIEDCLRQASASIKSIKSVVLFIPGFEMVLNSLKEKYSNTKIILLSDAYNAYYGALGAPGGIAVLSGTGSFSVGRTSEGAWIQAGAWGPLFDDEGSGYHLGILCLKKVTQLYDLGIENTLLQRCLLEYLEIENIKQIRKKVYEPDFSRTKVADLSHVVAKAAYEGDEYAKQLLNQTTVSLVDLVSSLLRHFEKKEVVPVSLIGGMTAIGDLFVNSFKTNLVNRFPQCQYKKPFSKPIIGSALYAMYELEHCNELPSNFLQDLVHGLED
jgi:N-acetylglucosamine kinase-like BadF-type ATPase